jgi:hypothetical protein
MNISRFSKQRLETLFKTEHVSEEYSLPLFNYLVHGFKPGSFWESVLANDFLGAMMSSHPSNQIVHLKYASSWISHRMPPIAVGSYEKVDNWLKLSEDERRTILEECELIYTSKEDTWLALTEVEQ